MNETLEESLRRGIKKLREESHNEQSYGNTVTANGLGKAADLFTSILLAHDIPLSPKLAYNGLLPEYGGSGYRIVFTPRLECSKF